MQKNMRRKGFVLGIIILFVGVSVIPSISGNVGTESKLTIVIGRITNLHQDEYSITFNAS